MHIFLLCVWVGGGWKRFTDMNTISAVIRHNNPINIWEISGQISGWTCAVCVTTHSLFQYASFPLYQDAPQQQKANNPLSIRFFSLRESSSIELPVPVPSTVGNKKEKTTTFHSVLTPTPTVKEAAAAVGGSELNSNLRKSKRADGWEIVGSFWLSNHLLSS